jgi:PIN domain nuclease of toxin-antitoxin system
MRWLLDTQVLLWAAGMPDRLPDSLVSLLEDPENILTFSSASLWEIVIKNTLGRTDFKADPRILRRNLLDNGYEELEIGSHHVLETGGLPMIHKDPFDRILVAQAIVEGITLITTDRMVAKYPGPVLHIQG